MEDYTESGQPDSLSTSPTLPLKTRITCRLISAVTDAVRRTDGTVNRRLMKYLEPKAPPSPDPINSVKTYDITVDSSRNLWFRIFIPTVPSDADLPLILFFHGGGFAFLSADNKMYDAVCRRFARKVPAVVVSVNYRLTPEHCFPAQFDDCFDVIKFLDTDTEWRKFLPENVDLSTCFLAGDSAGANIGHHMAIKASDYKFAQVKIAGLVSIQPFFGGEERTEAEKMVRPYFVNVERTDFMWRSCVPAPGNRDHEAINVSGPKAADLSGVNFPVTMVVVAGHDPLKDWQMKYYKWLKKSDKEVYLYDYPTMIHGFYIFIELPQARKLISQIADFIHECRKRASVK